MTAVDRIPIASLSLATILLVHAETGSFKTAGIVEAAFAIATAVTLPVQGRLVDRLGQTEVLGIAVALNPITLIGLVLADFSKILGASYGLDAFNVVCGP